MAVLLHPLEARGSGSPFIRTVLEALEAHVWGVDQAGIRSMAGRSVTSPSSPADAPVAEPLTDRERDVLRLLAAGQSTPEIARALYLEVNTVRTHVKHLYGKLGVHSRDQAIWRARELTLL
jgi:LuxR family maltose regulon positive regulatory protein